MPVALHKAKLSEKTMVGGKFMFLKLELTEPNKIAFDAGQYILLNTPLTPQKRQYSIVSAPRLDHAIELLVELIPNGVASGYLNSINPGTEVDFYAPAGEFTIKPEVQSAQDPLVLIGTGSGIAPLRSMALDQLRTHETKRPIWLYWGMRYADELFWLDELEELHTNFPNFSYHLTLSQAPDEWTLCRGRVTDCLSIHAIPDNAHYYICGNPHMIEDVMKTLATRGVDESRVHHEKFS
jgi:ferredoxin-NADP reductase